MFDNLFGSSKKSDDLRNVISAHEQTSSRNLHQKQPHLQGILDKHNIDLKNVRKNSVKVGAAAAVLGAFLAIPFLLGYPKHHEQPPAQTKTTGDSKQLGHSVLGPYEESQLGGGSSSVTDDRFSKGKGSVSKDGGVGVDGQPNGGEGEEGTKADSKSQGHKYGRSYLAPPKRHGLHDLGLHKGEGKSKGKGHEGPHPEELEVRHQEKGENS